jgi:hypothetical protein
MLATRDEEAQVNVESLIAFKEMQETYFKTMDFLNGRDKFDLSLAAQVYANY